MSKVPTLKLGTVGYIPGQTPYTDAEMAAVERLIQSACDAEEAFSIDELEEQLLDED